MNVTYQNGWAVPAGWKMVPEEPTEEMLAATSWPGCAKTDYRHMLRAAPQPAQAQQPVSEADELQAFTDHATQPAEPVKVPNDDLAHEIWAAAQTAPGEGIEDAVERVAALLAREAVRLNVAAPAAPQPAQQEPSEAERVCAEAYAVVGCLLSDLGLLETEQANKILDNLWAARIVHHDVLPWRSYESHCISEKPQEKRPDRWCSKNECRMIGGCSRKPIHVAQRQEQPQQEREVIGYVPISAIEETPLDGYVPVYAPERKD